MLDLVEGFSSAGAVMESRGREVLLPVITHSIIPPTGFMCRVVQ